MKSVALGGSEMKTNSDLMRCDFGLVLAADGRGAVSQRQQSSDFGHWL
jgi:hypothetical protein